MAFHANITAALAKYFGLNLVAAFNAGDSGVDFFFVLSGFVIYLAHRNDIGHPERVWSFLQKRFRRIYPPLWAVLLLLLPAYFLVPSFGDPAGRNPWAVISAFLITPTFKEYLLAPEWTLRHEILFYAVFGLVLCKPRAGLILTVLWLLLSAINLWTVWQYPGSFYLSPHHFLFLFGVIAAYGFSRRIRFMPAAMFGAGLLIFFSCWTAVCAEVLEKGSLSILLYGLGAAMAAYGAAMLELEGKLRVPRLLVFLGESSYAIYLVHFPVISIVMKIAKTLHLPAGAALAIALAAGALVGVVFHVLVEKPLIARLSPRAKPGLAIKAA